MPSSYRAASPVASCIGRCSLCVMRKRHALFVRRCASCVMRQASCIWLRCASCAVLHAASASQLKTFSKKCLTEIVVLLV